MRYQIILTGGTIGSVEKDGVLSVSDEQMLSIISSYQKKYGITDEFEWVMPFSNLSENATLKTIEDVIREILKVAKKDCDGIIVTHGTDTLSYTATFASLLLKDVKVPVIFVSSNKILTDSLSNGFKNFELAVEFLKEKEKGVFVSWVLGEEKIIKASMLIETDTAVDDFLIYGNEAYKKRVLGEFVKNENFIERCESILTNEEKEKINGKILEDGILKDVKVLAIKSYPGYDFKNIDIEKYDAFLIYTYHSSTLSNSKEANFNAIEFIKMCNEKNKEVFVASFKKKEKRVYESVSSLKDLKITKIYDSSFENAYANAVCKMAINYIK